MRLQAQAYRASYLRVKKPSLCQGTAKAQLQLFLNWVICDAIDIFLGAQCLFTAGQTLNATVSLAMSMQAKRHLKAALLLQELGAPLSLPAIRSCNLQAAMDHIQQLLARIVRSSPSKSQPRWILGNESPFSK